MALKRTQVLGWTKSMSSTQRMVADLSRKGQFDDADKLHQYNKDAHAARVGVIRRNSGRGR